MIRVYTVAQATKLHRFQWEHIHQQFTRSHFGRASPSLMFLLPEVHQALCTCFSLTQPETEGCISFTVVLIREPLMWTYFLCASLFRSQTNKLLGSVMYMPIDLIFFQVGNACFKASDLLTLCNHFLHSA
ncbi:hypothetical protein VPH35_139456 [Triticum aestivum]